jgi:uncharacterized membrane protein YfcA
MVWLALLFALTALAYATVGFGGGSTYNALLYLWGVDYRLLPAIALMCNILVVSGNTWRFARAGHVNWRRMLPLLVLSIPLAWLGGRLVVAEVVFIGILGFALAASGIHLLLQGAAREAGPPAAASRRWLVTTPVGGGIGLLAGITGIGGGIFLAPILHLMRWARAKEIAATCSVFILVNSIAGLAGQAMKLDGLGLMPDFAAYWMLFPAVIIGGFIGNTISLRFLSETWVRRLTAVLILYVALRLIHQWTGML